MKTIIACLLLLLTIDATSRDKIFPLPNNIFSELTFYDAIFVNDKFKSFKKKHQKPIHLSDECTAYKNEKLRLEYDASLINNALDSLDCIDWRNDTLFVISSFYTNGTLIFDYAVTNNKTGYMFSTDGTRLEIEPLIKYISFYDNVSWNNENPMRIFFDTVTSWDKELIEQMLRYSSGGGKLDHFGDSYAFRFIISDNKISEYECFRFPELGQWRVSPSGTK